MQERVHILVVEDDQDLRETLQEVLEDVGYSVAAAQDGRDALAQLRDPSTRPHLILLDLQMPNMDGAQFRKEQLKIADLADIPVAVLTADTDGKSKAAELNTAAYLSKPLKLLQLLSVIPQVLGPTAPAKDAAR